RSPHVARTKDLSAKAAIDLGRKLERVKAEAVRHSRRERGVEAAEYLRASYRVGERKAVAQNQRAGRIAQESVADDRSQRLPRTRLEPNAPAHRSQREPRQAIRQRFDAIRVVRSLERAIPSHSCRVVPEAQIEPPLEPRVRDCTAI